MQDASARVWKFGNNMDTDVIVPGQFLDAPIEEIAPHVFESVKPGFAAGVRAGDFIVAGTNFGCGSSREQAPAALKAAGIACIVAESFSRIFFRNAIAIGLPVMICAGVAGGFQDGQQARVSLERCRIRNLDTGADYQGEPFSEEIRVILERGGILEYIKARLRAAG